MLARMEHLNSRMHDKLMIVDGRAATLEPMMKKQAANLAINRLWLIATLLLIAACGTAPYKGKDVGAESFLQRALVQEHDGVRISTSVPTAEETLALTGLDLYAQGIQPVWLKLENTTDAQARVVIWTIDRDYFSPIEVAYMNRGPLSSQGYEDMQRWFHDNALPRVIPPGETRSGLVFTHVMGGTKGFNLSVIHRKQLKEYTFFVPMPGFVADFMDVDFASLYDEDETGDYGRQALREIIDGLGCCATNPEGDADGGPLNTVLVGSGPAVRRAMLRGGWIETAADAAIAERARKQTWRGRQPDAIFSQQREDGQERIVIQLWLSPWRLDGELVWLGQTYYHVEDNLSKTWGGSDPLQKTPFEQFFAMESPAADLDAAQRFLFQNLWYNGSLAMIGYLQGMDPVSMEEPRTTFGGAAYFTAGLRLIAFLSEEARAMDEVVFLTDPGAVHDHVSRVGRAFAGQQVAPPNDRLHIQHSGDLTITTAVPSAEEARAIFGGNLYAQNVQPVWVQVENRGDTVLKLTPMGVDRSYFTPREAANRSRPGEAVGHAVRYESSGHGRLSMPPRSIQSGYIFSRVDEGTKSFNVDIVGENTAHTMTFFVPVPGLQIDHYELDPDALFSPREFREVSMAELVTEVEAMPCCVRDAKGKNKGDPLNLVFIGEARELYYAFMRAGWDETETIYGASLWKTAVSAVSGGRYRYSPVSALYVFDRPQDAAMQRARDSIHERNHLRIWMTPLRHEGKPVWVGQISRDIGVRFTTKTITTHKIDPDVDETREFLLEDLAFTQGVKAFGYLGGVGEAAYDAPRGNLTGDPYFTDGKRLLIWMSPEPRGLDEIEPLDLTPYQTGVVGP